MKPIRVLTLSKPYVAASYRNKLVELSKIDGLEVGLVCPLAWGEQNYEKDDFERRIWTRKLPILFNGKNHFHIYKNLKNTLREFKPDIVNVEEEHYSIVTWQAYRAALSLGAKTLFYTWQNIDKSYPFPFSNIEQYVFKHSSAAVSGNQEAADILIKKGFKGPLKVIPQMGVEIDRFTPPELSNKFRKNLRRQFDLDQDGLLAVFAGRIVEEKGIQDVIDALSKIPKSEKINFLVLGSGPFLDQLKQQSNSLGETRIQFKSQVPSTDVAKYLQASDLMILPSLTRSNWKEQFGRIIVEAMAAGAVPVGSNSGEIPNVIGDAGFVFPEGDSRSLGDLLQGLCKNYDLIESKRSLATARAKSNFSNKIIAEKFADIFFEIRQ